MFQDKLKVLPGFQAARCNNKVKMDSPKVVDTVDIEDIGSKGVFCRCWKSNKFPYCDGKCLYTYLISKSLAFKQLIHK